MNTKEFMNYLGDNNSHIEKIYILDLGDNNTELKEIVEDGEVYLEGLGEETDDMDFDDFFDLCLNYDINFIAQLKIKTRSNVKLNKDNQIQSYNTGATSYIDWLYGKEIKDIYKMAKEKIEELETSLIKKAIKK